MEASGLWNRPTASGGDQQSLGDARSIWGMSAAFGEGQRPLGCPTFSGAGQRLLGDVSVIWGMPDASGEGQRPLGEATAI